MWQWQEFPYRTLRQIFRPGQCGWILQEFLPRRQAPIWERQPEVGKKLLAAYYLVLNSFSSPFFFWLFVFISSSCSGSCCQGNMAHVWTGRNSQCMKSSQRMWSWRLAAVDDNTCITLTTSWLVRASQQVNRMFCPTDGTAAATIGTNISPGGGDVQFYEVFKV